MYLLYTLQILLFYGIIFEIISTILRCFFMKKKLKTVFLERQHMLADNFEIYYYEDRALDKVPLHSHNYYEFYFFLEGDVKMQIDDSIYTLKYGDIILIPPHISHRVIIHKDNNTPYRRFVFWISQEYCHHLSQFSPVYEYIMQFAIQHRRFIFHTDQITFNTIQSKLLLLLEEYHSNRFGRDAKLSICVEDLILYINRLAHEQNTPKATNIERSLYRLLLDYIEEHIDEDLSLERLAEQFFVSKYHISHLFKDKTGLSIHQYITKKRLALCKEAIQGQMNISEAFQMVGFGDYSSFYRAFKKEYGISPKDFRDMQITPDMHNIDKN